VLEYMVKVQGGIADLVEAKPTGSWRTMVPIDDASFVVRFVGYRTLGNVCSVYVGTEAAAVQISAAGLLLRIRNPWYGRYDERPSPESSPFAASSGGQAEAKRSGPERPALSKSAGGPARDCGPPGAGAPDTALMR
jgi:hypothetical protein